MPSPSKKNPLRIRSIRKRSPAKRNSTKRNPLRIRSIYKRNARPTIIIPSSSHHAITKRNPLRIRSIDRKPKIIIPSSSNRSIPGANTATTLIAVK